VFHSQHSQTLINVSKQLESANNLSLRTLQEVTRQEEEPFVTLLEKGKDPLVFPDTFSGRQGFENKLKQLRNNRGLYVGVMIPDSNKIRQVLDYSDEVKMFRIAKGGKITSRGRGVKACGSTLVVSPRRK